MGIPDPNKHLPPGQREREAAPRGEAARGVLFAALLHAGGLPVEEIGALAAPLAKEPERVAEALGAFLERGAWQPPGAKRSLSLEALEALPRCGEWLSALDVRSLRGDLDSVQRFRLGRLYELSGEVEKAAGCYRVLLSRAEPLDFSLAAELALATAESRPALAYAAVDRLAAAALHRPGDHGTPGAERAATLGALLERGRAAALAAGSPARAAALGRAATSLLERANQPQALRAAQLGAIEALCAAGQADLAMGYAKRMREAAQAEDAAVDEARAILAAGRQLLREGERDKALALARRAATILEEADELLEACEPRRWAGELLAARGQLEQARQEVAGAAARLETGAEASDPARRRAALLLRGEEVDYALRLGKPHLVLTRADQLRRAWEELAQPGRAAGAMVVLAQALLLGGDRERCWKALERAADELEDPFARASSLRVRAELRCLEGDHRDGRLLLHDAERNFRAAGAEEWAHECALRRGELLLSQGERAGARVLLEKLRQARREERFELRRELLAACLSDDDGEQELLFEDLSDRAESEGQLADRVLVAAAKARRHLAHGDRALAQGTIQPLLAALLEFRQELPAPLQKGLRDSPLGRPILTIADELNRAGEEDADPDED